jgi:hypothetical protein
MDKELELLTNNLNEYIEDGTNRSQPAIDKVLKDGELLTDRIATLGEEGSLSFSSNGGVKVKVAEESFVMHNNAITQTADKLGVNGKHVRDLINSDEQWQRDLIAHTLNQFSQHSTRNRVLVREVAGQVRAVLSDKYRRFNSHNIYSTFLEASANLGMQIIDAHYNDLITYIEVMYPKVFQVPTDNNGTEYLSFGSRLRHSDFGRSRLDMNMFTFKVKCLNGWVGESIMKQVHLGSTLPEAIEFANDTMEADTKAQQLALRDVVSSVLSGDNIQAVVKKIKESSQKKLDFKDEYKKLVAAGSLTKADVEVLDKIVTDGDPEQGMQGRNTLWKLSNGINALGNVSEDPTKKREFEELAGQLIDL